MKYQVEDSYWSYKPNKGAPIVFAVLFLVSTILHTWQSFRYRSWRMTFFLPWGSLILTAGYALRAVGAWHYDDLNIFIASTVMIIMGPPVYAVCLSVTLGRAM